MARRISQKQEMPGCSVYHKFVSDELERHIKPLCLAHNTLLVWFVSLSKSIRQPLEEPFVVGERCETWQSVAFQKSPAKGNCPVHENACMNQIVREIKLEKGPMLSIELRDCLLTICQTPAAAIIRPHLGLKSSPDRNVPQHSFKRVCIEVVSPVVSA